MLSLDTNCAATVMASPEVAAALAALTTLSQKDAKRGQAPKRPAADCPRPA
jgi:hypothetical protein